MTDHDVRNLQSRGAEVLVLESHYTAEDLKQAREDCKGETGKTPNQPDSNAPSAQNPDQPHVNPASVQTATPIPTQIAVSKPTVAPAPTNTAVASPAQSSSTSSVLTISSAPAGADIFVDDDFVGNTPSTTRVALGKHTVTVRKTGFQDWIRNMNFSGGSITLNAELDGADEMHAANVLPASTPNTSKPMGWIGVHAQNSGDVAVVSNVNPDSPGAKAGIQVGDVIVALDGRLIKGKDFESIVAALKPGTQISVNYAHGATSHEVQITVGSHN